VDSLETTRYEHFLTFLISITAGLLLYSTMRLYAMWTEFRRLLLALWASPLRRGFARMKSFAGSQIWRLASVSLGELRHLLARENEALNSVLLNDVPYSDALKEELETSLRDVRAADEKAMNHYLHSDTQTSGNALASSATRAVDAKVLRTLH